MFARYSRGSHPGLGVVPPARGPRVPSLVLACAAGLASSASATAAELGGAKKDGGGTASLETMIVTAKRLEYGAQAGNRLGLTNRELPATLDVITQEQMQTEGLRSAIEAIKAAPGVTAGNIPGAQLASTMRGFTGGSISYLVDGVRLTNSALGVRNWDSWNFERVEVLKGPSSVLYGEGVLAGAINFVPKMPRLGESTAEALASYGSFGSLRAGVGGNAPLGRKAAIRVSGVFGRSSGHVDDTDSRTGALTAGILVEPTERLSVQLSADYGHDDYKTAYFGLPLVGAAAARKPSDIVQSAAGLVADEAMRDFNYDVSDGLMASDTVWIRSKTAYRLSDALTAVNELSYYTADRKWLNAEDYTFNTGTGLLDRSTTKITHNQQVWVDRAYVAFDGTVFGLRHRLSIGGEYSDSEFFSERRFGTTASVAPYAPVRGLFPADTTANFPGAGNRVNFDSDARVLAAFGEYAVNLLPRFLVVTGMRYDRINLDRSNFDLNTAATPQFSQNFDAVSWRVGGVYDLAPKIQLFAQYSSAVVPVSSLLLISLTNSRFDLTSGNSVEGGVKATLFDDRASLTASVYRIAQDHILTRDPANSALTVQGGRQSSRGVELAFSVLLTKELRIDGSAALLEAQFDTLIEAGGANRAGNRPPNVPEAVFDLSAHYTLNSIPVTFGASVRHSGGFYTNNANTIHVGGNTVLDASASYRTRFGEITLRGRNLTDAFYADWSGFSATQIYLGAPRSVDVTFTAAF